MHEERNDGLRRNIKIAVQRYQFAIECLHGNPKRVLDLACGYGYGCHMLRQDGHSVIGYDISHESIEYANANYPGEYAVADVEDKLFIPKDTVVCLEGLLHFKNPQAFIDKLQSKEIIISAAINTNPSDGYVYRLHNLTEQEFRDMFKEWQIIKELKQRSYLSLYCKKKI